MFTIITIMIGIARERKTHKPLSYIVVNLVWLLDILVQVGLVAFIILLLSQ